LATGNLMSLRFWFPMLLTAKIVGSYLGMMDKYLESMLGMIIGIGSITDSVYANLEAIS